MHNYDNGYILNIIAFVLVISSMSFWFRDIISEGTGILRLIQYIFNFFYLNTAKAIPIEDVKQALSTYNSNLHLYPRGESSLYKKDKNSLGYYLAGLLEGDGSISIPALGTTTMNRILNPSPRPGPCHGCGTSPPRARIVFTSPHVNNIGMNWGLGLIISLCILVRSFTNLVSLNAKSQISKSISASDNKKICGFAVNTSTSTSLVVIKHNEIQTNNLIPYHQYSIFISLLLSRGWMTVHPFKIHLARLKFRQSYLNKEYIFHIFEEIFPYCDKNPYRFTQTIKGKLVDEILISTKWLHCFFLIYSNFYFNKEKRVPANIYDLITPLVLFHWITGGGVRPDLARGLIILTEGFNVSDMVKLINVLMVKYLINCKLLFWKNNPVIYIYRSSLVNLIRIIEPITTSQERSKFAIWNMLDNEIKSSGYTVSRIGGPTTKNSKNSFRFNMIQKRTFSTDITPLNVKLNPWFVTGFTDAEGCFEVYLYLVNKPQNSTDPSGAKWKIILRFEIHLHEKDKQLLEQIKNFFGVGSITHNGNSIQYLVRSVSELEVIIKHFDRYPLLSKKHADFVLFKSVVNIVKERDYSPQNILKIAAAKASINKGLSDQLKKEFSDLVPALRPQANNSLIPDPFWLAGFIEGEGCFFIDISKAAGAKLGERVQAVFQITQHLQDIVLMQTILSFLGCGRIKNFHGKEFVNVIVSKLSEIDGKVLPFLEKYPIRGNKFLDYKDFKKVVELMKTKSHLTEEGLAKIKEIKAGMNTKR